MNSKTTSSITNETDTSSLACIDGENLNFIQPLREFLLAYKMIVEENSSTSNCAYHIVVGASKNVKDILSRSTKHAYRKLAIIPFGSRAEADELSTLLGLKVAVINAQKITLEDSRVLFGFLCTNDSSVLLLHEKTEVISPKIDTSTTPEISKDEIRQPHSWIEDERRINSTMTDVYARRAHNSFFSLGKIILTVICFVVFSQIFSLLGGTLLLLGAYKTKTNSAVAQTLTSVSHGLFLYAATSFSLIPPLSGVPFQRSYARLLDIGVRSSLLAQGAFSLEKELNLKSFFESTDSSDFYTMLAKIKTTTQNSSMEISSLQADVVKEQQELLSTFGSSASIPGLFDKTQELADSISLSNKIATIFPVLAPPNLDRVYLVLFQNSMELRPTGGFIGSVGILKIHNGRLKDLSISDVYDIDGQLRGHVDPPLPIRTILQNEHWYLRDSNWDPDFEISGKQAEWFYEKSGGEKVDGVIGVSLPFMQDLLSAVGPISIPEVKEPITASSLFPTIFKAVHEDYFPGSTEKKDLLGSIFHKLLDTVVSGKGNTLAISKALSRALFRREITMISNDSVAQNLLKFYDWSGAFHPQNACPSTNNCLSDFLGIVEANLAVSKVNYAVSRQLDRQITFSSDTKANITDTVTFTNAANDTETAGGTYTTYVRIYLPIDATVQHILFNNQELAIGEASFSGKARPYAERLSERNDLQTIGVAIDVLQQQKATISISQEQTTNPFSTYAFFYKRQPSTGSIPIHVVGIVPSSVRPLRLFPTLPGSDSSSFVAQNGKFEYTTTTDRDDWVVVSLKNHE